MNNLILSGSTASNTAILTPALSGSTNTTSTTPVKSISEIRYEYFLNKALGKEHGLTLNELNKDSEEIKNRQRAASLDTLPELLPDVTPVEASQEEPPIYPLQEVVVADHPIMKKSIYNNLPEMQPEEYQQLKNDIQKNGFDKKYPIWLYNGDILDGWNRQKVCDELGIKPEYKDFEGDDIKAYWFCVRSNNRRDLTPIQRACWAVDSTLLIEKLKKEAKVRMESGKSNLSQKIDEGNKYKNENRTDTKLAKEFKANRTYINEVQKIKKDNPEVFEKLKSGDLKLTELKKDEKSKTLKKKKAEYIEQAKADILFMPEVSLMDCQDFLKTFADDSVDLLFTDPPSMIDVPNILEFTESWLPLAIQKTKKSGRMLVCSGAYPEEIQAFLTVLLKQDKFIVDNPLVWMYKNTLVVTSKMKYNLNYQLIWHLYSKDSSELDTSITNEMLSAMEINAPDGRVGNRLHTWQKPDELARRLIRHTTKIGDLVVDPFTCTGTFLLAANRLQRIGKGCDNDITNLNIAISMGCQLIKNNETAVAKDDIPHYEINYKDETPAAGENAIIEDIDELLEIDGDVIKAEVSEYSGRSRTKENSVVIPQPSRGRHKIMSGKILK